MNEVTAISPTATRHIQRYFDPRFHPPGRNSEPCFQRSQIGIANATYRPTTPIETTALNATGTGAPLMSTVMSAGSVSSTATTADAITPCTGTRFALNFDQYFEPGTAPSRLQAKSMRVVLVMQAVVQKNCPIVAMPSTRLAQLTVSAWLKMRQTQPPPAVTFASS